jgi:ParB-like chromosome segregation protein Spo0J
MMKHPIDNVVWLGTELLDANDYNPNVVISPEMRLLKTSLLRSGWIQPILVAKRADRFTIIDGFHRATLAKADDEVRAMTGGKVPCCVMELSEPERMMLTVRINRAKGSHVAVKMHELVSALIAKHHVPVEEVCRGIGASKHEVELLAQENVFKTKDIENHAYSRAWTPK